MATLAHVCILPAKTTTSMPWHQGGAAGLEVLKAPLTYHPGNYRYKVQPHSAHFTISRAPSYLSPLTCYRTHHCGSAQGDSVFPRIYNYYLVTYPRWVLEVFCFSHLPPTSLPAASQRVIPVDITTGCRAARCSSGWGTDMQRLLHKQKSPMSKGSVHLCIPHYVKV